LFPEDILSPSRFGTYLQATGHNRDRALDLYGWNQRMGAAFMPVLCAAEIALRNRISARIEAAYAPLDWWAQQSLPAALNAKGKGIVLRAVQRLVQAGRAPDSGRMTAELTFGFWVKMLLPHHGAAFWSPLHPWFPDLPPQVDQAALLSRCEMAVDLRNRISHHEPIFARNHTQDHRDLIEPVHWQSQPKGRWMLRQSNVMAVMRGRP
jgi:hypothetical protein